MPSHRVAARISIALRGVRPSQEELARVDADPDALPELVDEWLASDLFAETVRDLHAEVLSVRSDTKPVWPGAGILAGETLAEMYYSLMEAPLELVEGIVMEGAPYTEIVTADYTMADARLATMLGLPYEQGGPEWQRTVHVDGRGEAGLMSSTGVWQRWYSNNSGKHRNRANFVSRAFLCEEIGAIDMFAFPTVDPSDNLATANALETDPACSGCHEILDPLAAYFWGYELNRTPSTILNNCASGSCYPLDYWSDARADDYLNFDLPPPGYYGQPGADLVDLGQFIASDPRFAPCAAQNAWTFLAQQHAAEMPADLRAAAATVLVSSGWDWRAMVRYLVLSDAFVDPKRPVLQIRPEAMVRHIASLTDHRWMLTEPSWGESVVLTSSLVGLRDLAGGTDQDRIQYPNLSPNPGAVLSWEAAARMAADYAVEQATLLDPTLTTEPEVRAQMADLIVRATSEPVGPDDPAVDDLFALFQSVLAIRESPAEAWAVALRALLMDPRSVTY